MKTHPIRWAFCLLSVLLAFAVPNIEVSSDDDDDKAKPSANQAEAKKAGAAALMAAQTRPAAE